MVMLKFLLADITTGDYGDMITKAKQAVHTYWRAAGVVMAVLVVCVAAIRSDANQSHQIEDNRQAIETWGGDHDLLTRIDEKVSWLVKRAEQREQITRVTISED